MNPLINTNRIPVVNHLTNFSGTGRFRFITKCRAGFLTVVDSRNYELAGYLQYPATLLTGFRPGALQTVQFQPEGTDIWLNLFARVGKRVYLIDEAILRDLTVGDINQYFQNTNLYSQTQYAAVGAKTWADPAFVMNDAVAV